MDARRVAFRVRTTLLRPSVGAVFDEFSRTQSMPPGKLARQIEQRSQNIAMFAMENSPFYAELYRGAGVRPDEAVWQDVPVIDRTMVKENAELLRSTEFSRSNTRHALTGGSTGQPIRVFHDARIPTLPLSWRLYSWWGVKPWDDLARVARWGFGRKEDLKNVLIWWPSRQFYADASSFDGGEMGRLADWMDKRRPALLEGYVGALVEFAAYLEKNRRSVSHLKAAATTAAPLTEEVRRYLESVFKAPVYDEYRSAEFGWTAGECTAQDGLHVFADSKRIEIVDDDDRVVPDGEVGHLVVTDLNNRVYPLIRYRNGDMGYLKSDPCECGISLPRMGKVQGRTTDVIRLPGGKIVVHRLMAMFSEHPEAVRLFQIHQRHDYSITIRVVPDTTVRGGEALIEGAVEDLRKRLSYAVPVSVEYVENLPYTGGKIKYVISEVVGGSA